MKPFRRQRSPRVRLLCSFLAISLAILFTTGCSQSRSPLDMSLIQEFTTSEKATLAQIETKLGPGKPLTSLQQRHLENSLLKRMPDKVRANAQKDKQLSWGDDSAFFIAIVNEEGIAWAKCHHSGQFRDD